MKVAIPISRNVQVRSYTGIMASIVFHMIIMC